MKRSPTSAGTGQKRDDPNMTRPIDGSMPVLNRKRRFVLKLIEHGQACPMKFIDEVNTTPIHVKGSDRTQRHVADLRYTPKESSSLPSMPSVAFSYGSTPPSVSQTARGSGSATT